MYINDPILEKVAEEKENHDSLNKLIEKYGNAVALRIIKKEIWIGMTDEMAKYSVGEPIKINQTINSLGIYEQ